MADNRAAEIDLQLQEHRGFQEKFWVAERFGWLGFLGIVLLALLGLTGSGGPLAHATAEAAGVSIEYPRVTRWEASDEIVLRFPAGGPRERSVTLGPEFAEHFQIEDIQPAPDRFEITPEGERMIFRFPAGGPGTIAFHIRAGGAGLPRFALSIDGGAPVELAPVILP